MRYLGGKYRQARHIAAVINKLSTAVSHYYEPFLGGAAVLDRVAAMFTSVEVSDVHADLMMMWQACAGGWWVPPESVSEEEYNRLRTASPSALRGFVGFGCSYGGKWFGGYAREKTDSKHTGDICSASRLSVMKSARVMLDCNARILHRSYEDLDPKPGSLIYCDPPYAGTTGYSGTQSFDYDVFWALAQQWSEELGCIVLVSEYSAPDGIQCLLETSARKSVGANTEASTERLFALGVDTHYHSLLQ